MKGLVVGVDESPNAAQALRWAVEEGAIRHEPVTAVMAWGYIAQHTTEPNLPFNPDYHEADARAALAELVRRAVGTGTESGLTLMLVCDLAPRALLEAANGCDVARRRREGCRRCEKSAAELLDQQIEAVDTSGLPAPVERRVVPGPGSVSDQLTLHASCPVVVLPAAED